MTDMKIMQTVKIRKTGNSLAISLPADFEGLGYTRGAMVVVIAMPTGELRVVPQGRMSEILQGLNGSGEGRRSAGVGTIAGSGG